MTTASTLLSRTGYDKEKKEEMRLYIVRIIFSSNFALMRERQAWNWNPVIDQMIS